MTNSCRLNRQESSYLNRINRNLNTIQVKIFIIGIN